MHIFFIDVDNTLIFGGKFPSENRDAIREARKAGNLVIINTGRGKNYIPWHLLDGIEYDGIIAGIGSYVEFRGKQLYCNPMTVENCLLIYDVFEKNGKWNKFEGIDKTFFQNGFDENYLSVRSRTQLEKECALQSILKFTCAPLSEAEKAVLSRRLRVLSYGNYCEGTVMGESKGKGIQTLLKYLDISTEVCVAVGDSKNDLEMFNLCRDSAAMGNSEDCIKEICTYQACHAADGGVADAINHFMKRP